MKFDSLFSFMSFFKDDKTCEQYYTQLRFNGKQFCVHCGNHKVYTCTSSTSKTLYKCPQCNKKFNIFVNTFFENTKISIQKWFICIYILQTSSKGISSVQLARQCGVTQKTAWIMLQKIRNSFGSDFNFFDNDIVEIDETYIGGKESNKHSSKKTKNTQGRSLKTKIPVIGILSRNTKKIQVKQVKNVKSITIKAIMDRYVSINTQIYTDEFRNYNFIDKKKHSIVNHRSKEYVNGNVHTNGTENFWSIFKRGYIGIYHWMSKKHLQKYINEFMFRYNHKQNMELGFDKLLLKSKKLTYRMLING